MAGLLAPKIDMAGLVAPKVDFARLLGSTLRESGALEGVGVPGLVATGSVFPDVSVSEIARDMTLGELLGGEIDASSLVRTDVPLTDLLADRLRAESLLGDQIDTGAIARDDHEAVDPQEDALVRAILARVDELQNEMSSRLGRIEASLTLRRQLVLVLVSAVIGIAGTVAVVQIAPELTNPEAGRSATHSTSGGQDPSTAAPTGQHAAPRPGTTRVEDINSFLQDQLRAKNLAEVRAVEAARWLDDAGALADSPSIVFCPRSDASTSSVFCCAENFRYCRRADSLNAVSFSLSGPSSDHLRTEPRRLRRLAHHHKD